MKKLIDFRMKSILLGDGKNFQEMKISNTNGSTNTKLKDANAKNYEKVASDEPLTRYACCLVVQASLKRKIVWNLN